MTTHGQPEVAHNGSFRSAAPPVDDLAQALRRLRTVLAGTAYPLVLPDAEQARQTGAAVAAQIDDYLLPRLTRMDGPLLVVVGGSTGTGKSTLVNSLVRAPVSAAGVLRPTTRAPVLVAHPEDLPWFRQNHLLPGLTRTTRVGGDPYTLRLVAAPAFTPGLALLDAPDIDSVVATNRDLAVRLLSAADLWLFVTSAARYADALPWDLLRTGAYRGTSLAVVLNRVPAGSAAEVVAHLTELLSAHELNKVPLFVLPETAVDGHGLLAEQVVAPVGQWLAGLATDAPARMAVVRHTMDGALSTIEPIAEVLAEAADGQATTAALLAERADAAYRGARDRIERDVRDGALLRGEALARWREFTDAGALTRTLSRVLHGRGGNTLRRMIAAVSGDTAPKTDLRAALESALVALVRAAAAEGAEQAYAQWQAHPIGADLLRPDLAQPSADLAERTSALVSDWRRDVLDLVQTGLGDQRTGLGDQRTGLGDQRAESAGPDQWAAADKRTETSDQRTERIAAVGLLVVVAALTSNPAVSTSPTTRVLAQRARHDLFARVDTVLDAEAERFLRLLPTLDVEVPPARRLREAGERVERARIKVALP